MVMKASPRPLDAGMCRNEGRQRASFAGNLNNHINHYQAGKCRDIE